MPLVIPSTTTQTTVQNAKEQKLQDNASWIMDAVFGLNITPEDLSVSADVPLSYHTTGNYSNLADTSLGGNIAVNPVPQFTELADPPLDTIIGDPLKFQGTEHQSGTYGMGEFYYDAIETKMDRVTLQFGLPKFNSLANFFLSFYDPEQGAVANTGEIGLASKIAQTVGTVLGYFFVVPLIPILVIAKAGSALARLAADQPGFKFYYIQPNMGLFYHKLTMIANYMAGYMQLTENYYGNPSAKEGNGAPPDPQSYANQLNDDDPDYAGGGSPEDDYETFLHVGSGKNLDIRAIARRYARKQILFNQWIKERVSGSPQPAYALANEMNPILSSIISSQILENTASNYADDLKSQLESTIDPSYYGDFADNMQKYIELTPLSEGDDLNQMSTEAQQGASNQVVSESGTLNTIYTGIAEKVSSLYDMIISGGSEIADIFRGYDQFVTFNVGYQKEMSESFSTSTKPSPVAEKLNSVSKSARTMKFNMAGGNVDTLGIIGSIVGVVQQMAESIMQTIGVESASMLFGNGFIQMQDMWDDTKVNLSERSYTLKLRSPSATPYAIWSNLMLPLAYLIAAASPNSTGMSSYTSPFLCRLWHKGRNKISLGIIKSLNITRATTGLGYSVHDMPLGIDVTFSVQNLDNHMHFPIVDGASIQDFFGGIFNEENTMTDYLFSLTGMPMEYEMYAFAEEGRLSVKNMRQHIKNEETLTLDNYLASSDNIFTSLARAAMTPHGLGLGR